MAQMIGKTIYVLGAGASHHTGAPLLSDFLVKSKLLQGGKEKLYYKDSFERVFTWIDNLRGSSYYVELDLDNLEHIFSLADMRRQLDLANGEVFSLDIRHVVMETLDRCQLTWRGGQYKPDELYSEFASTLRNLNDKRMEYTGQSNESRNRDVIVTFNYDVMIDHALIGNSMGPEYCVDTPHNPYLGYFRVLKLHGSMNWASCRECKEKNPLQIVPPSPIPEGYIASGILPDGDKIEFKMVTNVLSKTKCKVCQRFNTLDPVIIPPTWSKMIERKPVAKVWKAAVEAIEGAFQIVVIGYSMPTTDTFFQYLLTLGLTSNPNLHRIVVINTDKSDNFKQRYKKVLARSLADRERLKFQPLSFEEFVRDSMITVGGQVEWTWEGDKK